MYVNIGLLSLLINIVTLMQTEESTLRINIIGVSSAKGLVQVLLFDGSEGFPDQPSKAVKNLSVPIKDAVSTFSIEGLKPGRYAVSAFHDQDEDGKMRKGLFGSPKDAYGFSNNARSTFSAPSFASAAFDLEGKGKRITIELIK